MSNSAHELADAVAREAARIAGYGGALLSLTWEDAHLVGCHGLTEQEVAYFRGRAPVVSLAERRANRARLRERAFPGTAIAWIPSDPDRFHVVATPRERGAGGEWCPDDALFVLLTDADGGEAGVLSFDAPADGRIPSADRLDRIAAAQAAVEARLGDLERAALRARVADQARELRARRRDDVLGSAASAIAHDLNNVLSAISAHAEVAQLHAERGDPVDGHLERVREACELGAKVVRRLLGSRDLPAPTDLVAELRGLHPTLARVAPGCEVALALPDAPLPVGAAPEEILQIALNLVVNARDAMGGTGRIDVSAVAYDEQATAFARLRVDDRGPGIPEALHEQVFAPWYTTREGGTGLGLATVAALAQRHEGRVRVLAVDTGAAIAVDLPRLG